MDAAVRVLLARFARGPATTPEVLDDVAARMEAQGRTRHATVGLVRRMREAGLIEETDLRRENSRELQITEKGAAELARLKGAT